MNKTHDTKPPDEVLPAVDVTAALHCLVHDMRSPLQTILSSIDVLDAVRVDDEIRRTVERLQRSAHSMDAHMADLATLMLIQSKAFTPQPVSFEVGDLLAEVRVVSAQSGLKASIEEPSDPVFAVADAVLIRGVLVRLVRAFSKLVGGRAVTVALDGAEPAASVLVFRVGCAGGGPWPQSFSERLLPAKAIASAIGGRLQAVGSDSVVLTAPAQIEDGDAGAAHA
jgi:K+-sensing histidine kinase KdpD